MKKISILIPCYNEEENVVPMSKAVVNELTTKLPQYDYELIFIDNDSQDNTRPLLREICKNNPKIKAIFNAKNFGQFTTVCSKPPATAPLRCAATFRIRLI